MEINRIKLLIYLCCLVSILSCTRQHESTHYYFNAKTGNDTNTGTSAKHAFQSLSQLKKIQLQPGDSIFLAAEVKFNQPLELIGVTGQENLPIMISTYPKNSTKKAFIKVKNHLNAILIENSSYVEIYNLDISAEADFRNEVQDGDMRCGVLVQTTKSGNYEHIYLSNLNIHDIFYEAEGYTRPKNEVKTANGTQSYGWGMRFINNKGNALLSDIKIKKSTVNNVAHTGIKLTSRLKNGVYGIQNFEISDNKVLQTGGPGIQMSGVRDGHIYNNSVDQSGSDNDSRKWGRGSGLWTWGSSDILIEHNRFTNANGPGDSAGAHIDFNCNNVVLQYNFSANNAGGFCEILGNNNNCAYRYNISVNDGHRIKGKDGAFQEGKIFWLSGYAGNKKAQTGPFNSYFYNNTIYVGKNIIPKIAVHQKAKGVLIANNIFHFENPFEIVKGDQYNPETKGDWQVDNVVFSNNLYFTQQTWPENFLIQDKNAFYGDANFRNQTGTNLSDFVPQNRQLIKNKGILISKLPMDSIGLIFSLHMEKDIIGNHIQGLPDLGAVEVE